MITYLTGNLVENNQSYLIIDCYGIGYYIHISLYTYSFFLKKKGNKIKIYTYLFIRENQHILYGFFEKYERKIFSQLISVSGIGPNLAIVLLSSLSPHQIEESIYSGNIQILNNVKGIGKKTAQKIIFELKDKMSGKKYNKDNQKLTDNIKKEALDALNILGFSTKDIDKSLIDILQINPNLSVENLIKEFLKRKK